MSRTISLPKWTELIVALANTPPEQCYCERLCRKSGMTRRHLRNLIADLQEMNLLRREEGGKIKYLSLTDSGQQLAELLQQIYPTLKR
jgi:predicted transcriptional regulator